MSVITDLLHILGLVSVYGILLWIGTVTLVFCMECLASVFTGVQDLPAEPGDFRLAILIPAHNEASILGPLLDHLKTMHEPSEITVVADNCSDETANIARSAGVNVTERSERLRIGKGYALEAGIGTLKNNPPDIVVVLDADCRVEEGKLCQIAARAFARNRPVQATYLIHARHNDLGQAISAFAILVKNRVRPLALSASGFPCPIFGSGFAIPWKQFESLNFGGEIVEDVKIGVDLTSQGFAPIFDPGVTVGSDLPSDPKAARTQRVRWEHGHLSVSFKYVSRLIYRALKERRLDMAVAALDLAVPPLSLLALLLGVALSASWFFDVFSMVMALLVLFFVVSVVLVWWRFGRGTLSSMQLLFLPVYVVKKLPIYLGFAVRRETRWIKTRRDS